MAERTAATQSSSFIERKQDASTLSISGKEGIKEAHGPTIYDNTAQPAVTSYHRHARTAVESSFKPPRAHDITPIPYPNHSVRDIADVVTAPKVVELPSKASTPNSSIVPNHVPSFNRNLYPAYDTRGERIGLKATLRGREPQVQGSHYRPHTRFYPTHDATSGDLPYVRSFDLASWNSRPTSSTLPAQPSPRRRIIASASRPSRAPRASQAPISSPLRPAQTVSDNDSEAEAPTEPAISTCARSGPESQARGSRASTPEIRDLLGMDPNDPVTLRTLKDPLPGQKPDYPYPTLITLAIHDSPRKSLTLQEIYKALETRFDWYKDRPDDKSWQNSIRHNLSLNKRFRRVTRPLIEGGKGCLWIIDLSGGEGPKRPRKRHKPNKTLRRPAETADTVPMMGQPALEIVSPAQAMPPQNPAASACELLPTSNATRPILHESHTPEPNEPPFSPPPDEQYASDSASSTFYDAHPPSSHSFTMAAPGHQHVAGNTDRSMSTTGPSRMVPLSRYRTANEDHPTLRRAHYDSDSDDTDQPWVPPSSILGSGSLYRDHNAPHAQPSMVLSPYHYTPRTQDTHSGSADNIHTCLTCGSASEPVMRRPASHNHTPAASQFSRAPLPLMRSSHPSVALETAPVTLSQVTTPLPDPHPLHYVYPQPSRMLIREDLAVRGRQHSMLRMQREGRREVYIDSRGTAYPKRGRNYSSDSSDD